MSKAITALVSIMCDSGVPLRRRIEASDQLLGYEAPTETVAVAKTFLTRIFEDASLHVDDRLDALKLMRKAEARKITQPTMNAAEADRMREVWRSVETGRRRAAMIEAGMWPPASNAWAVDLRHRDYKAPAGSMIPTDIAESVRHGRARATAKNP